MKGVRILDLSRVLAGPWATQHLADQGAEVVKIEPPGGDETRAFAPFVDGWSTYFLSCNRNKRSVALDLSTDAGREVVGRLADASDVLVHNFRPGVAERLGVGWADLKRRNPRLIYVCLHAFGADVEPPWATRAGYDLVLQAMGGAMSFTGPPGLPPTRAGTPVADLTAGLLVVQAVLHGLLQRERTGAGQRIEVNMMQAQAASLVYHYSRYTVTGEEEQPRGNAHRGLVPYDVYRCRDGWLALACGNDGMWQRLRRALEVPDREEWRRNPDRVADREGVDGAVSSALAALSVAEADARLAAAGVPAGPVLGVADVQRHPAVHGVRFQCSDLGEVEVAGPVLKTSTTRRVHAPPPALGADRDAVLAEVGYDPEDVARLAGLGAFGALAAGGPSGGGTGSQAGP